jgi:hypothetical protein
VASENETGKMPVPQMIQGIQLRKVFFLKALSVVENFLSRLKNHAGQADQSRS